MLVLAASLLLCGLCSCVLYVVLPLSSQDVEVSTQFNILLGSLAGFGVVFGALLVWQGIRTLQGRRSVPAVRVFPPVLALVLAFVGAILLGIGALALPAAAPYLFPPWHLLAASLPPLALLAYGARRLGAASGLRALLVSYGWGALAGTTIAFLLEAIAGAIVIVAVNVLVGSQPDGRSLLDQLQAQLEQAQRTGDFSGLTEMLSQPPVAIGLLILFAVAIPLIEESVKTLVIAFIDPRRTGPADALLWGMGAGAGFATIESILNASILVSAWALLVFSRAGAAIVHVASGALMGRGWYAARVERRWGQLVLSYGVSVLFHGLWNATAVFLSIQVPSFAGGSFPPLGTLPGGLGLVMMLVLALGGLAWIVYAVRTQSRRQLASSVAR